LSSLPDVLQGSRKALVETLPFLASQIHPLHLQVLLGTALNLTTTSLQMCSGSEAGSYLRLIDSCITQIKAQGPSRTCNESKEKEEASRKALAETLPFLASQIHPLHLQVLDCH